MLAILRRLLESPILARLRRNHALEHATIHLLSGRQPRTMLVGRADLDGFYLYGDIDTESVRRAAHDALERLRLGEHQLAIHPNCGTNLLTAGILASLAVYVSLLGGGNHRWRNRLERLPLAILGATLAIVMAQPLGAAAQKHITTLASPGHLEVVEVHRYRQAGTPIHRVLTRG